MLTLYRGPGNVCRALQAVVLFVLVRNRFCSLWQRAADLLKKQHGTFPMLTGSLITEWFSERMLTEHTTNRLVSDTAHVRLARLRSVQLVLKKDAHCTN